MTLYANRYVTIQISPQILFGIHFPSNNPNQYSYSEAFIPLLAVHFAFIILTLWK